MIPLWNIYKGLRHYHRKFGLEGLKFIWRKKFGKAPLIRITPPGFQFPIEMRRGTEDAPMFYYIFDAQEFNISLSQPPEVIIDCGAHIGLGAVFFAQKYPDARIFAVEPERANFELLRQNTRHYPNITCLHYGIWNKTTYLRILDVGLGNWGFMTEETDRPGPDTVEAISIDEIMNRYGLTRIDLCKINIEGTEKELFEENTERWLPITRAIIIELHDRMRPGCTRSFFRAMSQFDFELSPSGSYFVCQLKHEIPQMAQKA